MNFASISRYLFYNMYKKGAVQCLLLLVLPLCENFFIDNFVVLVEINAQ